MELLRREDVTLEVCVTSNLQTCAVKSLKEHPVRRFFDEGVRVTWNTDDPTVSDISLRSEEALLVREFGFSESDLAVMQQNAIEASFAPAEWKRKLRKELSFNKSSKVTDGKN